MKNKKLRKWNKDKIIKELKEFAHSFGKTPKEIDFREKNNYGLYKATKRYFGGYTKALEIADLKPNLQFWSKDKIVLEFKKITSGLGYVPTYRDLVKLGRHDILSAIRRHFQNQYNIVVKKCGFQPNNIKWDKAKVKEDLIKLSRKYKRTPTEREIREEDGGLFGATTRYYGSLSRAIESAGLEKNKSFVEDDFWKYWESFIIRILQSLYTNVEVHPRLPNRTIPDARIDSKIIEVKLNVAHEFISQDINNYLPYAKKIEIWHLYGKPRILNSRVSYIGFKKICVILK